MPPPAIVAIVVSMEGVGSKIRCTWQLTTETAMLIEGTAMFEVLNLVWCASLFNGIHGMLYIPFRNDCLLVGPCLEWHQWK